MKGTQHSIMKYIKDRGLTEEKIKKLINETENKSFIDDYARCPRCRTKKIRIDKVEWTQTAFGSDYSDRIAAIDGLVGRATYKDQIICEVCDLYILDPNNERRSSKSIWNRLHDFLFGKR